MTRTVPLALGVLLASGALAQSSASFTPLGSFSGGSYVFSAAHGLSDDGRGVVGEHQTDANGNPAAFRWTASGGFTLLGAPATAYPRSGATGVSADGRAIVGGGASPNAQVEHSEAYVWAPDGSYRALGDLSGGDFLSFARGVSSDGRTIVGGSESAAGMEAFRWTEGGGMQALGDLPGDGVFSIASAVSREGDVVVGMGFTERGYEAFRWTETGGMVGLGDFANDPLLTDSEARDVSEDGTVVVGVAATTDARLAFRWTPDGGMMSLGTLPGAGASGSHAEAVSPDGRFVVGRSGGAAFLWDAANGMRDLRGVLAAGGLDGPLAGWTLESASGVTLRADGALVVAGTATGPDGRPQAFVANLAPVPEPATLAALGLGALALLRRRRG